MNRLVTMKTVIVLAAFVVASVADHHKHEDVVTKSVDAAFIEKQRKILTLFDNVKQVNHAAEYYETASKWSIEANVDSYTNKYAVKEFLTLWRSGFMPKLRVFSVFHDRLREEAIALFGLFYYAKDFDTFYKTAAWARVHINRNQFAYAYYIALLQRPDTQALVLPAPYEINPELFTNINVLNEIKVMKEQQGSLPNKDQSGLKERHKFVMSNDEQRISYFTEDLGLNSYYYEFHTQLPFWWNGDKFGPYVSRRGELYYFFYKQLLNRYYFERLTNGLGPIPEFSWFEPIRTGYYPQLQHEYYPFVQRPDFYNVNTEENYESLEFLDSFEKSFLQFLEYGRFKAFDQDVDFHDSKTLNFVGNYWQYNADLFHENFTKTHQRPYEATARRVLGAALRPVDSYTFLPTALDFYQTSLRDPAFWQLYNRIMQYIIQFKKYLAPYKPEELHFKGVKIEDMKVNKLLTYFDMYEYNATNAIYFSQDQLNSNKHAYFLRQPRLNHKPYTITLDVMAEKDVEVVFKIFLGPKYDSNGNPVKLEDNWSKFFLLDWFSKKLVAGKNEVKRMCTESAYFKQDPIPIGDVIKMLDQAKVPKHMSEDYDVLPIRLMLPRGTKDGFPFQMFVYAYPYEGIPKEYEPFKEFAFDVKPFSYPFDRPVKNFKSFYQPNMFFKNVFIYHEGEPFPYNTKDE